MPKRKIKVRSKFLDDMGLCITDGAMLYGYNHGALRWAPRWVKHSICHVWNVVHCAIAGHDPLGYEAYTDHVIPGAPKCSHCCARLKINGRYPTPEEVRAHNEIVYKNWEEYEREHKQDALWE